MARPHTYQSFCRNPLPIGNNELAGATSTKRNGTLTPTFIMSHVPTPAPAPLLASTKVMAKYTNADLQRATKLALKLFV